MRRSIFCSTTSTLAFLYLALVLFTTSAVWAAPGFDLDLKELKKPSQPTVPKKTTTKPRKKKNEAKSTPKKQPAIVETKPAIKQPETAVQAVPEPSELILHRGDNPCQLAERVAVALARTVPTDSLLNGLDLKPVATVNRGQLDLMVVCGLPDAEA